MPFLAFTSKKVSDGNSYDVKPICVKFSRIFLSCIFLSSLSCWVCFSVAVLWTDCPYLSTSTTLNFVHLVNKCIVIMKYTIKIKIVKQILLFTFNNKGP